MYFFIVFSLFVAIVRRPSHKLWEYKIANINGTGFYYVIITIVRSFFRKYHKLGGICIVTSAQNE